MRKAFTLVELILVTAIIAMISVTIGVSLRSMNPRKLENEVQRLVSDLSWAKSMAVTTHYDYLVDFDVDADGDVDPGDNRTYIISRVDIYTAAATAVKRGVLAVDSLSLTPGPGGPSPLLNFSFMNPQGNLNDSISDPVTITLGRSNTAANVTIRNVTGHISWERL